MKFFVATCNQTVHTLNGFAYLFNKFWSSEQEVTVLCFDKKPEGLPSNFINLCLGDQSKFGRIFTDPLIPIFDSLKDEYFMFTLDDHWLFKPVDFDSLERLKQYVGIADRIILSDELFQERPVVWTVYEDPDILTRPTSQRWKYFNQGFFIYKKEYWLKYLKPGRTVWEFETEAGFESQNDGSLFIASKNFPCHYRDVWTQWTGLNIHDKKAQFLDSIGDRDMLKMFDKELIQELKDHNFIF
jgi:hypothetical protein